MVKYWIFVRALGTVEGGWRGEMDFYLRNESEAEILVVGL